MFEEELRLAFDIFVKSEKTKNRRKNRKRKKSSCEILEKHDSLNFSQLIFFLTSIGLLDNLHHGFEESLQIEYVQHGNFQFSDIVRIAEDLSNSEFERLKVERSFREITNFLPHIPNKRENDIPTNDIPTKDFLQLIQNIGLKKELKLDCEELAYLEFIIGKCPIGDAINLKSYLGYIN